MKNNRHRINRIVVKNGIGNALFSRFDNRIRLNQFQCLRIKFCFKPWILSFQLVQNRSKAAWLIHVRIFNALRDYILLRKPKQ